VSGSPCTDPRAAASPTRTASAARTPRGCVAARARSRALRRRR
jgi:hypothetical protein